jgi:hypothetical protein
LFVTLKTASFFSRARVQSLYFINFLVTSFWRVKNVEILFFLVS